MNTVFRLIKMDYVKILSVMLGIFALALTVVSQSQLRLSYEKRPRDLVSPPKMLSRFAFGQKEIIADSLWIRSLQDFDYCDQKVQVCQNNTWLFKMLDVITDLSPHFRIPYAAGGLALTVLLSDIDGATALFDKGVQAFPKDWTILYRAAYHYLYEVKDNKKAAELLIEAGKYGAPPWVFTLAGRLYSDSGNLDLAKALLQEMKDSKQDPTLIERLEKKIESMKAEGSRK